jgi:hypothetical protein
VPRIQRWKRQHNIQYIGLDSAFGTSGKPEDSEAAMAYNRAFEALDVGGMAIAHVRKDGQNQLGAVYLVREGHRGHAGRPSGSPSTSRPSAPGSQVSMSAMFKNSWMASPYGSASARCSVWAPNARHHRQ